MFFLVLVYFQHIVTKLLGSKSKKRLEENVCISPHQSRFICSYRPRAYYDGKILFSQVSVPHPGGGGGCTSSPSHNTSTGPMSFRGGDVPQWLVSGWGYPGQVRMGVPWPGQDRKYPNQVRMGYPLSRYGVPPSPTRDGVPHSQGWGTLPARMGLPPPPPRLGQQMEYLIRGGRYASCVHAGGLSCSRLILPVHIWIETSKKSVQVRFACYVTQILRVWIELSEHPIITSNCPSSSTSAVSKLAIHEGVVWRAYSFVKIKTFYWSVNNYRTGKSFTL